jgi:hypothetical protein
MPLIDTRLAIIKKSHRIIVLEKVEPLYIAGGNEKWFRNNGKQCQFCKTQAEMPYHPKIMLLAHTPWRTEDITEALLTIATRGKRSHVPQQRNGHASCDIYWNIYYIELCKIDKTLSSTARYILQCLGLNPGPWCVCVCTTEYCSARKWRSSDTHSNAYRP